MSAAQLVGVSRSYASPAGPVLALDGLDLTIEAGHAVAVMGRSGSGKSTLLHLLGALDRPSGGTMNVLDTDIGELNTKERRAFRRANVGFVFQSNALLPHLTALENIAMQEAVAGRTGTWSGLDLLDWLGVGDEAGKVPDELSAGQRQRVAIARALVHGPRLLLADEPTGSLDSTTSHGVITQLLTLVAELGATLVAVTHDTAVAGRFGRTLRLADGRVADPIDAASTRVTP